MAFDCPTRWRYLQKLTETRSGLERGSVPVAISARFGANKRLEITTLAV